MIISANTQKPDFFLAANMGSTPYTSAESNGPYYYAFVELTARKSYSIKVLTQDVRFRVATFASAPNAANVNGIRTLCEPQSPGQVGYEFTFTADDNEHVLVVYCGGAGSGATGSCTFELEEIENPHNYSSVEDMINAGISKMTVLVNNVAYDDNAYTITNLPTWLKYNNITPSEMYTSGNTWFGVGSQTEHIKFNRRDTKMYYLYREDGTVYGRFRFLKLRWRGYSVWNQTGSSYLQEWEVIFFDTGDVMIHAVTIPASSYDGSFNIVASQTYTYTKPTAAAPYVTFYTQNENNTVFEIDYNIIQLKCWNDKWLIEDEGTYYNIVDGELNPLEITEITTQNMVDYGNDERPDGELLLTLTEPTIYRWNDSDIYLPEPIQPTINVNLTAYPFSQTIDLDVDMSHETILDINGVTAQYSGNVTVRYSLDDGETYSEDMSLADFLNEDFKEIFAQLPEDKKLYLTFTLQGDATLTNVKFTFKN